MVRFHNFPFWLVRLQIITKDKINFSPLFFSFFLFLLFFFFFFYLKEELILNFFGGFFFYINKIPELLTACDGILDGLLPGGLWWIKSLWNETILAARGWWVGWAVQLWLCEVWWWNLSLGTTLGLEELERSDPTWFRISKKGTNVLGNKGKIGKNMLTARKMSP